MGTYITQTQLENRYGASLVRQLTDEDEDASADSDAVDELIALAEARFEARARTGGYSLPVTGDRATAYARWIVGLLWLHMAHQRDGRGMPEHYQDDYGEARRELKRLGRGLVVMPED